MNDIFCFQWPKPDWVNWKPDTSVKLFDAAALLCNIDPASLVVLPFQELPEKHGMVVDRALAGHPQDRLIQANHFNEDNPKHSLVELTRFAAWAKAHGFSLPREFPRAVTPETIALGGWPWGSYSNKNLELLALAAHKWWVNYSPDDPSTAPRSEDVIAWLEKQGLSNNMAKNIASILRVPGLKPGPR